MATQEVEKILNDYKTNLLGYKVTGSVAYKQAYQAQKTWLDTYNKSLQTVIQNNNNIINKFTREYRNTNPEITTMQNQIKMIKQKGPQLEDEITAIQERNQSENEVDWTPFYSKLGVIGALVGVAVVVTTFG
jgi:CHASE3 domain sensor protein